MFKWTYHVNVETEASPEQVWAMWQDVASWPSWDSELKWARLDGDFVAGTRGRMQPSGGPEVAFTLSRVELNRGFSDVARLPLARIVFDHDYISPEKKGGCAEICHSVTITGWLAPLFGRVIGGSVKKHLRGAMEALSQRALTGDKTTT